MPYKEPYTEEEEQALAREQRQELRDELTENFTQRLPKDRRRVITFSALGGIALLALIFIILVLLPAPPQQPHGGVAVGSPAPDFTLSIQGGSGRGSIALHALHGHPVVLNFWSESCQPCLSEMPYLRGIYARYGVQGAFTLLGVNQADPREDITRFGTTYKLNYPLLYDAHSTVNVAYGVTSLPMTYFVDSNGIVRFVVLQQLTPTTMQQGLQAIGVSIA
ncbi:MAG: TlpA disulfide reductase family protein [Ktedonobacteraceae bacterium]